MKKKGSKQEKGKGAEENREEDINHAALGIEGTNLHDLLAICVDAFSAPSNLMFALMNSTAR